MAVFETTAWCYVEISKNFVDNQATMDVATLLPFDCETLFPTLASALNKPRLKMGTN